MGTIYNGYGLGSSIAGSVESDTIYRGFGLSREIVGSIQSTVDSVLGVKL